MKVLCSCGREGILEVRGGSSRVVHYEWVDGKRIFTRHRVVGNGGMGTVGTGLGTDKDGNGFFGGNKVDRWGFEPQTSALRMRRSYQTELPAHGFFPKRPAVRKLELCFMFFVRV